MGSASCTTSEGGTVTIASDGKSIEYTPKQYYYGTDSFTYTISDGDIEVTKTVDLIIEYKNYAPEFHDLDAKYETDEDIPKEISFTVSDVESKNDVLMLQATITTGSSLADVTVTSNGVEPKLTVTPKKDQNGTVIVKLTLSDGTQETVKEVTVVINPVNDTPVANNDSFNFDESTPLTINISELLVNDTDVDITTGNDDEITFVEVTVQPVHGTLEKIGDTLVYTPEDYCEENDSFKYKIRDIAGETSEATVTLICIPVNDPPTLAEIENVTVKENGLSTNGHDTSNVTVQLVYSDPETANENLIVSIGTSDSSIINTAGFSLNKSTQGLTITPIPYQNGTVTVTVSDGENYVQQQLDLLTN